MPIRTVDFNQTPNGAVFVETYSEDGLTITTPAQPNGSDGHLDFFTDTDGDGRNEPFQDGGVADVAKDGGGRYSLLSVQTFNATSTWIAFRIVNGARVETGRETFGPGTHNFGPAFRDVDVISSAAIRRSTIWSTTTWEPRPLLRLRLRRLHHPAG